MSFLIAAGGLAVIAFVLAYIRSGRFGLAALSLAAGYILAQSWVDTIVGEYGALGQTLGVASWRDTVYVALVTLPALFVLILSPKRQSILPKLLGAIALAILVVTLLLPIFSLALIGDDQSRTIYAAFENNKELLMTSTLILGLADVAFARHPKRSKHGKD